MHSGVFFNEFQGVWVADETLSQVFHISLHQNLKPGVNWEIKS